MRLVTPPQSRQEEGTHHSQPLTSLLSHPHPHSTSAGLGLYLPLHWQNSTHETLGAIIASLHKITSSFPFPPGSSHTTELQPHSSLSCGAAPSNSHTWQPAGPLAFLQQCSVCNHPLLHTSYQRPALCQWDFGSRAHWGSHTTLSKAHLPLASVGNTQRAGPVLTQLRSGTGALRHHILCPPWTCCILLQAQGLTRATLGSCCSQKLSFWCWFWGDLTPPVHPTLCPPFPNPPQPARPPVSRASHLCSSRGGR